ncbi:hypothetical protein ACO0K9_24480 [Undibacterium sp. Ji50W]|uniref:hypothetical protein n=1 Tax=Undibacterium sp. Ji50W TaxID=3413041 RepID=UPI003BF3182B
MYRKSFPACTVKGSLAPVPYGHMVLHGAVPEKCTSCKHLFEGSCTRALDDVEDYQSLDYGPCTVNGPCTPVPMPDTSNRILFVPEKCQACTNLTRDTIRGYICNENISTWRSFPRSLDWGEWHPIHLPMGIQQKIIATDEVLNEIAAKRKAQAVVLLKSLYVGLSTAAAIQCVDIFAERLNSRGTVSE